MSKCSMPGELVVVAGGDGTVGRTNAARIESANDEFLVTPTYGREKAR